MRSLAALRFVEPFVIVMYTGRKQMSAVALMQSKEMPTETKRHRSGHKLSRHRKQPSFGDHGRRYSSDADTSLVCATLAKLVAGCAQVSGLPRSDPHDDRDSAALRLLLTCSVST